MNKSEPTLKTVVKEQQRNVDNFKVYIRKCKTEEERTMLVAALGHKLEKENDSNAYIAACLAYMLAEEQIKNEK